MKNTGLFILICWIVFGLLHYFVVEGYGIEEQSAIIDSAISNGLLLLLCTGAGFLIRFYRPDLSKTIYILIGAIFLSLLYGWIASLILEELTTGNNFYLNFLTLSLFPRTIIGFLMIVIAISIGWIAFYNNEYQEEKNRLNETFRLIQEAELTNLIQKIQPHFLFNTLNSVNALIQANPAAARKMVQQLSDFLRGSLKAETGKTNKLSFEINQLNLYFEIEKVRFGERLITKITVDPKTTEISLPPLLIQPLVENAVKFGLYDTLGMVEISINTYIEQNYLFIKVSNPFDHQNAQNQSGTGFGLSSLQKRLQLLFNRNDLLQIHRENGIFTAILKIPVE